MGTIGIFLIGLCLVVVPTWVFSSPVTASASDNCPVSELVLDSDVVTGQVTLTVNRRRRPATTAEVEMFAFRDNEWQSIGKIYAVNQGYFTWLDVAPGKYMLVASLKSYASTKVFVRIKRRRGKEKQIIIPLKIEGCAYPKLKKAS
jgi:hypothetical protein